MQIAVMTVTFYAPWVHSLKEKRMEVKSLIAKLQQEFHVSAAEVDGQDVHQTIVIGIAAVCNSHVQADSILDHLLNFMECSTQAEIISVDREIL